MRLLLDTHVFIWVVADDPRLTLAARELIVEADAVYVSSASVWEIAIKSAVGKIDADMLEIARAIKESGFSELPISVLHAAQVANLPMANDHKDPFDRLLLAQAVAEPLILLTADTKLLGYGGSLIRAV